MNCPKLNVIVPCHNAVIGAGSLVTKDIPANTLAYGVPCRVIKKLT